ncbi:putative NAD dependent epimerase/dehydratase [Bisporella sp. PMI_857]|nr:putative NAD dependent epimerase/dehydratase [Bisporella sp. PMI_857]
MALPTSKNQAVLITGVNGYIASRTAEAFLNEGYNVRGTVRNKNSAAGLLEVLEPFVTAGRLEIVEVKDITIPGAFDEAVKGVHAIIHMASPVSLSFDDPDPVIKTAIEGTQSVLNSGYAYGSPTLKSVVLTSSIGAILGKHAAPYTYTENDWNDVSEALVAELGKSTPSAQIYLASKTAGEKAFWKFRDEKKPAWTMTAVNPVFVGGPPLVVPESADKIHETVKSVYTVLNGEPIPPPLGGSGAFVDVRDVARLMVFSVSHPEVADGERYIACGGVGSGQAVADILREHYKNRKIAVGNPGEGYEPGWRFPNGGIRFDSSKAVKATGKEWIPFDKSVLDAAKSFEKLL